MANGKWFKTAGIPTTVARLMMLDRGCTGAPNPKK